MSTEAEIETVPAAQDNKARTSHLVCQVCYPERPPALGTPSVCGERVLGVPPVGERCQICTDLWDKHVFKHRFGGRG